MKTLELKHLAPYLPYRLKCKYKDKILELDGCSNHGKSKISLLTINEGNRTAFMLAEVNECKPILRPLSDLTKEIEVNGTKFVPAFVFLKNDYKQWEFKKIEVADYFKELKSVGAVGIRKGISNSVNYRIDLAMKGKHQLEFFQKLFEWHFDCFDLIKNGLAIDINTL